MSGPKSMHHVANANKRWLAVTIEPDYCRVGDKVIGFDTTATLDNPVTYSPNVTFASLPAYRVGDMFKGTQGNAGKGIVSGTSGADGYVKIVSGLESVKVNGKAVARHGSECIINCDAYGKGGARGMLVTLEQSAPQTNDDDTEESEAEWAVQAQRAAMEAAQQALASAALGNDPGDSLTHSAKQGMMGFTVKELMDTQAYLSERLAADDSPAGRAASEETAAPSEPGVFIQSTNKTMAPPGETGEDDEDDGLADKPSACEPQVDNPVNPVLGVKLLPAETDFALSAPQPFVFSRGYLSSNANVGPLGQGWSVPGESLVLTLSPQACIIHDAQGRKITFGSLAPGQQRYSPSEGIWVRRAGGTNDDAVGAWAGRWAAVPESVRFDAGVLLVSGGQMLHLFRPSVSPEEAAHPAAGEDGITPWRLRQDIDRNGYTTTYQWDDDRLTGVEDSAGRHYALCYTQHLPASEHDSGQRLTGLRLLCEAGGAPAVGDWLVRYSFSAAGDMISVHARDGKCVRTFEWANHILIAHHVPGGLSAYYRWDRHTPDGRVIEQREAGGPCLRYHYDADSTRAIDETGATRTYHFSGQGPKRRWTALTHADGSRTEYRYDRAGRKVATIDPLGRETRTDYDAQGQRIAVKDPAGQSWQLTRAGALGLPTALNGPQGLVWKRHLDARGNLLRVTDAGGATTHYAYEHPTLPDRPTTITDPSGSVHHLEYNALGQITAQVDCSQQRTTYAYDRHGHLASVTNTLGETWRFTHDMMGRRLTTQRPDGACWKHHYDAHGRAISVTAPDDTTQRQAYDDGGRLREQIDADRSRTVLDYDHRGRLSTLTLGNGAAYQFVYDVMGRLTSETSPDGREQRYRYDAAGQRIEHTEARRLGPNGQPLATRYDYDALGQLTARHLPATEHAPASTEQYQWGANGQLLSVTNDHGEVAFSYDGAQRLIGEQQQHTGFEGGNGWSWQHQHTLTATGAPQASEFGELPALNWHTYGSGHLHGLSAPGLNLDIALEPDALHRETQRRLTTGEQRQPLIIERGYTATGQIEQLSLQSPNSAGEQYYRYDALGQMTFRSQDGQAQGQSLAMPTVAYSYDKAGHLIGSQHGNHAHRYPVDAAGNRSAAPNATNQLAELNGTRYRYDGAGNLIHREHPSGEQLTLGYDGANRLVTLTRTTANGQTTHANYRYDALGRRIDKTVHHPNGTTATTHYGWDGDRIVREETTNQRSTVIYEPGSFVPMLRIDQGQESDEQHLST